MDVNGSTMDVAADNLGTCLTNIVDGTVETCWYFLECRTVLEMLKNHGFTIPNFEIDATLQEFWEKYGQRLDVESLRISPITYWIKTQRSCRNFSSRKSWNSMGKNVSGEPNPPMKTTKGSSLFTVVLHQISSSLHPAWVISSWDFCDGLWLFLVGVLVYGCFRWFIFYVRNGVCGWKSH